VEIVLAGRGDDAAVAAAGHLFDGPARAEETKRFLTRPGHLLLLAYEDGRPVGFASGIEVVHPDKRAEMMLYEIAVDEPYRRRGIATALVAELAEASKERGCRSVFVLAEGDDQPAQAFYEALAPTRREPAVMYTWEPPDSAPRRRPAGVRQ
jgi:ribosomal protein S18 acetylase RimI-like enzyme